MTDNGRVLDHDYDGIREYDNPLPGWWVFVFWATVLFCFPYFLRYHFGEGETIFAAYEAEQAEHAERLLATYGALEPDAPTIVSFARDELAMAGMASLFRSKCAQCHRADGSGMVGPNLTDDRWLHVKQVEDIFGVLEKGVVLKGMPSWKDQLSKTQLVLMAAYVASLRAAPVTGPAGKEPQGEPISPWPEPLEASGAPGGP
jgi:cytochrome c oxidase cbb3-type subunit 3